MVLFNLRFFTGIKSKICQAFPLFVASKYYCFLICSKYVSFTVQDKIYYYNTWKGKHNYHDTIQIIQPDNQLYILSRLHLQNYNLLKSCPSRIYVYHVPECWRATAWSGQLPSLRPSDSSRRDRATVGTGSTGEWRSTHAEITFLKNIYYLLIYSL